MGIILVLILLVVVVILLSTERISPDFVALGLLVVLVMAKILTVEEAFRGFRSEFIIMLASVFIVGEALQQNGIIDLAVSRLSRVTSIPLWLLTGVVMFFAAGLSAFMNNTTVSAILVAPLMSMARQLKVSPSKLLMPMAFAALMGGTCTLIGTSTNIAGNAYLIKQGYAPMSMFELTPLGVPLSIISILFMMFIGIKFIPNRAPVSDNEGDAELTSLYNVRKYLSQVKVLKGSSLDGQAIFNLNLKDLDVRILKVIRDGRHLFPDSNTWVKVDDVLVIEVIPEGLTKFLEEYGVEVTGETVNDIDLESGSMRLVELVVPASSDLLRQTLIESDFRKKYHVSILAIHRKDENLTKELGHTELRTGDVLLGQGRVEEVAFLRTSKDVLLINEIENSKVFNKRKGLTALVLFASAIVLGSLEVLPMGISFLMAALLSIATGCITTENAYGSLDRRLLILIAGMTAFGIAMTKTGTDKYLAEIVVHYLSPYGVMTVLAGFMALTILLTQPMSNAAAALVVLPIAMQTAITMGVNPRTFAIAVIVSASVSMITPFEPCCILVYGAGQYKFKDFFKVGGILTLLWLVMMLILIPILWKF